MKKVIGSCLLAAHVGFSAFAGANDGFNDGIDRSNPNFITASLLFAEPADSLYSGFGHVCIRLQCPAFKLDTVFSEESEAVGHRILTFFSGKLKMGMFALQTDYVLKTYRDEGRGVRQYRLNLPPEMKQRLWKVLDDQVKEGHDLPYDYEKRGCSWVTVNSIFRALESEKLEILPWPAEYDLTRREIMDRFLADFKWFRFAVHAIWGTKLDCEVPKVEKIIVPPLVFRFLKTARIRGVPIMSEEFEQLTPPSRNPMRPTVFTPMMAAILFLLLAIANFFIRKPYLDWLFLGLQSAAGLFFCYLVCFSSLPATTWNWLIVPFNLLPLVFWRWRRYWAWPFAAVLVAWEALMIFYPRQLTDWAYVVIVAAYIVFYAKQGRVGTTARAG